MAKMQLFEYRRALRILVPAPNEDVANENVSRILTSAKSALTRAANNEKSPALVATIEGDGHPKMHDVAEKTLAKMNSQKEMFQTTSPSTPPEEPGEE